jgi:hypothetical protein
MFKQLSNIFLLAFLSPIISYSQVDLTKQLMANKWYVSGSFVAKSMTFSVKPIPKPEIAETYFLANGKMRRCDSINGSLFDKEGKEHKLSILECDSSRTYRVNKDMIHISRGNANYFYKVKSVENKNFEFVPVAAEEFNKK